MVLAEIAFVGYLTTEQLRTALEPVERRAAGRAIHLLVDCSEMESYEAEARRQFIRWHASGPVQVERSAVDRDGGFDR